MNLYAKLCAGKDKYINMYNENTFKTLKKIHFIILKLI